MVDGQREVSYRPTPTGSPSRSGPPSMTVRARRRREESVRRLVADMQARRGEDETHEWLVASTIATALEQGLDRELHTELVQETKDNASRIGQICHDHANVFLSSVAQVAALGEPSAQLAQGLEEAYQTLESQTAGPLQQAVDRHEQAHKALTQAKALSETLVACQLLATQLEKARKQALLGRPRAALAAVDQARTVLTQPLLVDASLNQNKETRLTLEQTPLGRRAQIVLPKLETEVLQAARRAWNRWWVQLRNGEQAKAGKAVLRQVGHAVATGPSQLSLGGNLPSSYVWRAQTAHNLVSRVDQKTSVARAARAAYWLDRDAAKEAQRIATITSHGLARKLESIAACLGWYRCWDASASLLLDLSEFNGTDAEGNLLVGSGSRHGSRHGLAGSRHGLRGSRHGKARSLGFRSTASRSQTTAPSTLSGAASGTNVATGKWAEVLLPAVLLSQTPSRREEDEILMSLPESVHPVRRAELAYRLLGRTDEFVQYYEQNRFNGGAGDAESERSALSALTGDDITLGSDRTFFSKTLPTLCASIVGFTAVEAALEVGTFAGDEEENTEESKESRAFAAVSRSPAAATGSTTLTASRLRESSERYERALTSELGDLIRERAKRSNLGELVRSSILMSSFRSSLKVVHPSSSSRRHDKDLLALDTEILLRALKISQDEQLRATTAIVAEDRKVPMLVADSSAAQKGRSMQQPTSGIPDPEEIGLPFGLNQMKQQPTKSSLQFQEQSQASFNRSAVDQAYTFSDSLPTVIRSLHARAIAMVVFALSQEELGQSFSAKKGSNAAGYVLDAIGEFVNVTSVGMKDSDNVVDEGSVEKAVQIMANIAALQHCLPRFLGTILRGMCHIGMIKAEELDETFVYAEMTLKSADKACDAQMGSTYSLVYEICRNKIDSHINYALENFNWVAKSVRDMPNAYCEGLIGYMRSVFNSLGPMDEGSRAGLHFSCCGHVSERLVKLLAGKPGDTATFDDSGLPPIARIDAFGIKNLALDCDELEKFADSTAIPQLRDCFNELRVLTSVMLDKDLPMLVMPENVAQRRRKYPILSMDKVGNILEKYVGTGLGDKLMGGSRKVDILFIDKKEVQQLIKIVRSQGI